MKRILMSIVALPLLSGCGMMQKATPESRAKVLQVAEQYSTGGVKSIGKSSPNRKPIREGQWVASLTRSKSDPNDVMLQVAKVAKVQGNEVTLEIENYSAADDGRRIVMQQQYRHFPVTGKIVYSADEASRVLNQMEIARVKMLDQNGQVVEVPSVSLGMANQMGAVGAGLVRTNVSTGAVETRPCENGHFRAAGCYVMPFETSVLWKTVRGQTYAHSEIPIVGYIRSDSNDSDVEVIGYGDRGAQIILQ